MKIGNWKLKMVLGFTLVEMMVVISIILLLTLLSIPIYQGTKKELTLQRATNKLAQDIKRAQEMAMGAKRFENKPLPQAYGIYFNLNLPQSYELFFDDATTSCTNRNEIEKISLERGIRISQIFLGPSLTTSLTICFVPPDPLTTINQGTTTATITLQINNSTSSVKVLPTGLIYVE